MYKVVEFETADGKSPFTKWLLKLPKAVSVRIQARLYRFESGLLGDYKRLGQGLFEARIHFGSGYRVYFGIEGQELIVLLIGGDKGSQKQDIKKAKEYWQYWKKEGL